ncbi:hypothetical protein JZY06_09850 [Corynebacterium sp. CCM 8862]|uniref:Uncharacterized protein n=2 Tax=Corynebacterium mendelii TaxID=2765362 RepID=A0A939E1W0_9CORY|nr:hypothetical protein [Corynebacterium mendelii]
MATGTAGVCRGWTTLPIRTPSGEPAPVQSIASGLGYPGDGPQHAFSKDLGRVTYSTVTCGQTPDAFATLCSTKGLNPALESGYAVTHTITVAHQLGSDGLVIAKLSGRGDKDADYVAGVVRERAGA